jgi:hypothetical protein
MVATSWDICYHWDVLHPAVNFMRSFLFSHGQWNDHFSFNRILSFTNSNFVEVKRKLGTRFVYMVHMLSIAVSRKTCGTSSFDFLEGNFSFQKVLQHRGT